jgi:hypothetical protein
MGWLKNPKRAAYNKIYHKTTIGIDNVFDKSKNVKNQTNTNNLSLLVCILTIIITALIMNNLYLAEKQKNDLPIVGIEKNTKKDYMKIFLTTITSKSFVPKQAENELKDMIKYCSEEEIYEELFSEELKQKISLKKYKSYNINPYTLSYVNISLMPDESIYIYFNDEGIGEWYYFIIKDEKIITFKRIE